MLKGNAITFGRLHTWTLTLYYIKAADTLSIKAPWRGDRAVWVELADKVRIKVDAQTGEAVEFHIGDFQRGFQANRADLAPLWGQVKPTPIALRRMENTPFIHEFLEHMERLAYDRSQMLDPSRI